MHSEPMVHDIQRPHSWLAVCAFLIDPAGGSSPRICPPPDLHVWQTRSAHYLVLSDKIRVPWVQQRSVPAPHRRSRCVISPAMARTPQVRVFNVLAHVNHSLPSQRGCQLYRTGHPSSRTVLFIDRVPVVVDDTLQSVLRGAGHLLPFAQAPRSSQSSVA